MLSAAGKAIPVLASIDLQPGLELRETQLLGMDWLLFFFFFAYQIHLLRVIDTGDDINDKKPAPSYPSISEYWQFLVIVEP